MLCLFLLGLLYDFLALNFVTNEGGRKSSRRHNDGRGSKQLIRERALERLDLVWMLR
jgi:hypothetical protein